jgi:hypothetical protein
MVERSEYNEVPDDATVSFPGWKWNETVLLIRSLEKRANPLVAHYGVPDGIGSVSYIQGVPIFTASPPNAKAVLVATALMRTLVENQNTASRMVEFGRMVHRTGRTGYLDQETREMVLRDFEETRLHRFPKWKGEPEITQSPNIDALRRFHAVGWYAQVPQEFLVDTALDDLKVERKENDRLRRENDRLRQQVEEARKALGWGDREYDNYGDDL